MTVSVDVDTVGTSLVEVTVGRLLVTVARDVEVTVRVIATDVVPVTYRT